MGGIDVVIPNNDRATARICQEIDNFDNFGENYRPSALEDSIKLAETPPISNNGRGGLSPFASLRAFKVGLVGSQLRLDIPHVRQVVNTGGRDVKVSQPR